MKQKFTTTLTEKAINSLQELRYKYKVKYDNQVIEILINKEMEEINNEMEQQTNQ